MNQALSYLDLVIACVAVMVMATSIVLTLTQLTLAALKKRRKILTTSLAKLLEEVGLPQPDAGKVAAAIVGDPRVEGQGGSVVTREYLVELLLQLAVDNPLLKTKLGVDDPKAILQSLRDRVLKLEVDSPALADHVRRTQAIVEKAIDANGKAVMEGIVKIMSGFDRVCDQMTQNMRTHARVWTVVFSAIVAIALPLDSIAIVKRLANDPAEVKQLVETAKALKEAGAPTNQINDDVAELQKQLKTQATQMTNPALGIQPGAVFTTAFWCPEGPDYKATCQIATRIAGILISIALMSLGAPFWFDALKNLLALRPSLASKETGERAERATTKST